jgi:hypothetical protein
MLYLLMCDATCGCQVARSGLASAPLVAADFWSEQGVLDRSLPPFAAALEVLAHLLPRQPAGALSVSARRGLLEWTASCLDPSLLLRRGGGHSNVPPPTPTPKRDGGGVKGGGGAELTRAALVALVLGSGPEQARATHTHPCHSGTKEGFGCFFRNRLWF